MRRAVVFWLVVIFLNGCRSDIEYNRFPIADGQFIIAGPGSRIISERVRFDPDRSTVLCTEPSPDVAVALASSGNATISGGASGASGSLGGGYTSSQTVTALDGRTAGVVALRDGLYFACQAYANGVLGLNSYSLILSEYSVLLRELVSGGDKAADPKKPATTATPAASQAAAAGGVVLTVVGGSMSTPGGQPAKGADGGSTSTTPSLPPRNGTLDRAMLVSCIAENDPTRIYPQKINGFLRDNCSRFIQHLVDDSSMATVAAKTAAPTRRTRESVGR